MQRHLANVYRHEQTTAATTWTITHNLGVYPIVDAWTMYEGDLQKILPAQVNYVDENTCTLVFTVPISGFATVV